MEWLVPVLTEVNDVTFIEEGALSGPYWTMEFPSLKRVLVFFW